MYKFSKRSRDNLSTASTNLQKLFNEVIKETDCTVICGHRSPEEQFELFKKGRENKNFKWVVVDKSKVVTNIDGRAKKSNHNYLPSKAVDVVPYPLDWNDISAFKKLGEVVKRKAKELGIKISWGGDWQTLKDYPHYEEANK